MNKVFTIRTTTLFVLLLLYFNAQSQVNTFYCEGGLYTGDTSKIQLRYVIDGREWDCRFLTYYFVNGTADVSGTTEYNAVLNAMESWAEVTNIDFLQACNAGDADIRISWETGDHGDDDAFGTETCGQPGNIMAHGFYPDNNDLAGDVHFDDAEGWAVSGSWACGNIDVETIALHELGHSLGLNHSSSPGAVMNNTANQVKRNLTSDDINGIRAIYGYDGDNPINGNGIICKNSSTIFGICLTDNISVTWSVTSNLQITGGQGNSAVFIKATGTGMGVLTALISSGCESIQFTRDIEIVNGVPDFTKLDAKNIDGYRNLKACEITEAEAIYTGSGPILRYEWDIPFSTSWFIDPITSWPPYRMVEIDYFEDPTPSTEDLSLRAKNVCGWSAWIGNPWSVTDNCPARTVDNDSIKVDEQPIKDTDEEEILSLSLYPTIANDVIHISWTGLYDKTLSVDIYNSHGSKVKTFERLNSSNVQLIVGDLPPGLFYCHIKGINFQQTEKFLIAR